MKTSNNIGITSRQSCPHLRHIIIDEDTDGISSMRVCVFVPAVCSWVCVCVCVRAWSSSLLRRKMASLRICVEH